MLSDLPLLTRGLRLTYWSQVRRNIVQRMRHGSGYTLYVWDLVPFWRAHLVLGQSHDDIRRRLIEYVAIDGRKQCALVSRTSCVSRVSLAQPTAVIRHATRRSSHGLAWSDTASSSFSARYACTVRHSAARLCRHVGIYSAAVSNIVAGISDWLDRCLRSVVLLGRRRESAH